MKEIIKEETTRILHATLGTRRLSLEKRHDLANCQLRMIVPSADGPDEFLEVTIRSEEDLAKLEALVEAARTVLEGGYGKVGAVDAALPPVDEALPLAKSGYHGPTRSG